jgi:hypothetical protein
MMENNSPDPIDDEELAFTVWQAFESLGIKSTDEPPAPPPLTREYLARRIRAVFNDLDMQQLAIARRLSGAQRLAQAFDLCDWACSLIMASIRNEQPDISEAELKRRVRQRIRVTYEH